MPACLAELSLFFLVNLSEMVGLAYEPGRRKATVSYCFGSDPAPRSRKLPKPENPAHKGCQA